MALIILLLFITVPIAEIGLFIQVGGWLGLWPTLGVVILTAVIGTALLRHQGLGALRRVQESLAENRLPVTEMFDGLCLLLAGALLLTPGFLTDALGFTLFIPPLRAGAARAIGRYILRHGQVHVRGHDMPPGGEEPDGPVIDGDFEELAPDATKITDSGPETTTRRPINGDKT